VSDPFRDRPFPRAPLLGAAALIGFALVAAGLGRMGAADAPLEPSAAVVARDLRFEDQPDGSVVAYDARTGEPSHVVEPGTGGFVRATLRTFARERRSHGVGPEAPFRLAVRADGRLTLEDTATGRRVALEAFGATNAGAFARFLADSAPGG
jgi:putative photosynthetic complex assembly protein